jgi:TonB family protein
VRHHEHLRCGMEFVGLPVAQQAVIREWAESSKAPAEPEISTSGEDTVVGEDGESSKPTVSASLPDSPQRKRHKIPWTMLLIMAALLVAGFWWRWNRGWEELEAGLSRPVGNGENRVHVPAEVMEKLLVHRVDPEYPAAARAVKLQGVIVLDVIVGPDGSVVQMRPLNGPEVLSRAAMEALRWWKFQPYRVKGQAVEVETTVAVEFKSPVISSQ